MINKKSDLKKRYLLLFGLIFLFFLGQIYAQLKFFYNSPSALAHDEKEYLINGKFFSLFGLDTGGSSFPSSLFVSKTEGNVSFVPVFLLSLWEKTIGLNPQTAKIPNLVLIFGCALLTSYLAFQILNSRKISLLILFLFLLNPWAYFLSRFATESPYALFFFLLGLVLFLTGKSLNLFLAFLAFWLGFFSYHGAKISFLPLIASLTLILPWLKLPINKPNFRNNLIFLIVTSFCFAVFVFVSFSIQNSNITSRTNELVFFNQQELNQTVNHYRNLSVESVLKPFFLNRLTIFFNLMLAKFSGLFSPEVLFLAGDSREIYRFYDHGLFYLTDALFLLIGFYSLFQAKKRPVLFLLIILIIVGLLPSVVNRVATSYVHRAFLVLPCFIILAGHGLYLIWQKGALIKKPLLAVVLILIISVFYLRFLFFYHYLYPVSASHNYAFEERLLSRYIELEQQNQPKKIIAIVNQKRTVFLSWLFYTNKKEYLSAFFHSLKQNQPENFYYQDIVFTDQCPTHWERDTIYLVEYIKNCPVNQPLNEQFSYTIYNPKDAGTFYDIYNSSLCQDAETSTYVHFHQLSNFDVEKMDQTKFCQLWIAKKQNKS